MDEDYDDGIDESTEPVWRHYLNVATTWLAGREAGCFATTPLWQRGYICPLVVAAVAVAARSVLGLHLALLVTAGGALLAGAGLHWLLERFVFGGWHCHCDECGSCTAADGPLFADDRNAIAYAISELGWFVAKRGRVRICPAHPEKYPYDYAIRPRTA